MYIYICIYIYIYIYIYTYTYIHIYIYIHIYLRPSYFPIICQSMFLFIYMSNFRSICLYVTPTACLSNHCYIFKFKKLLCKAQILFFPANLYT